LITRLPIQGGLLTLALLVSVAVVVLTCQLASIDPISRWILAVQNGGPQRPTRVIQPRRPKPIGIYQFDPLCGYGHIPNSQGHHDVARRTVTYTIDGDGCRMTPTPTAAQGTILITGGSFTFGYGVEDDECFPGILASRTWPNWKVQNRGVCGYGTSHCYLILSSALENPGTELPSLVLYAMIPDHVRRNYLRKSWVDNIGIGSFVADSTHHSEKDRRGHPHFELDAGQLVFQGLIGPEDALQDTPCMCYPELMLTKAFLSEMHGKCAEKNVPFVVVLLPEEGILRATHASLKAMIDALGILCLDLSDIPLKSHIWRGHPNSDCHELFAEAISDSFIIDMLPASIENRPDAN
jgi:hypothetical protein